jgi:apolipoprotein N-acyltransferase
MINSPHIDGVAPEASTRPIRKTQAQPNLFAYRLMILYRFFLAGFGGYVLAALSAILIAQFFSDSRSSAAMSATLIGFTLQACAFIWVFMVNKTLKATLGIVIPCILLYISFKFIGQ